MAKQRVCLAYVLGKTVTKTTANRLEAILVVSILLVGESSTY